MGRNSTGALITSEVSRIELSYLLKKNFLKSGCHITGTLSWTNGNSASIETICTAKEKYLRIKYTLSKYRSENKEEYDYKILLTSLPSNLGKGEVLYFLCPVTGKPCRILYMAYGSPIYKSRPAYSNRIYYPLQLSSKMSIYNDRYWRLERTLEILYKMRDTGYYKGKRTKRSLRTTKLREKQEKADYIRWSPAAMPLSLRKELV